MTLFPSGHDLNTFGEEQTQLQWQKRPIIDAEEMLRSFFYVELESIDLKELDKRNLRPLCSAKLCQLQFQFRTKVNYNHLIGKK